MIRNGLFEGWHSDRPSGKRVREVKSERYSKKLGSGSASVFSKIRALRMNSKRVVIKRARKLRSKVNLKFCTPDAYKARFSRPLEQDGLTAAWHMVKGLRRFGIIVNMDKEGEVDMVDEEEEGVEHVEEIESGEDDLREGQSMAKYNRAAVGLDATVLRTDK